MQILEEGKAFELAGNRWHLNCFRCNTCNTLLDSDANLLLLGDGSLICNNCTYSCSACGDKIEDLAILTGEQAFCAACFRCRNCKRKIENLRYAKTSQGIFCMSCHESLMARRRKKSKAAQAKAREKDSSVVEKSLPALPPNAIPPNAFSNDRVDPESDTPTELPTNLSPRPRPSYPRNDSDSLNNSRSARSPERPSDHAGLSLPSHTYRPNRNSALYAGGDTAGTGIDDQSFFIPVALDPSPLPSATPRSTTETLGDGNKKTQDKDYFNSVPKQAERKTDSQSSTPHIAFQEKGRQASSDYDNLPSKSLGRKLSKSSKVDRNGSSNASSVAGDDRTQTPVNGKSEDFRLQDAPKSRKLNTRTNSQQSNAFQEPVGSRDSGSGRIDKDVVANEANQHLYSNDRTSTPRSSQDSRLKEDDENRLADPLAATSGNASRPIARKELPHSASRSVNGFARPTPAESKLTDTYMAPRAPPAPPGQSTAQDAAGVAGEHKSSPKLPIWNASGDFSMDEDMARILGTDEGSSSILRRVSNAVRHGRTNSTESSAPPRVGHTRSVSETTRTTASPRWPKTPIAEDSINGATQDITSPLSLTPGEDNAMLKRRLRNSEQRVAELERQFNNEKDLKSLSQKVEEKRKTVSVLDTQTEIMIRQLEALAGYVEKAKETKKPVDPRDLEESAIRDFVQRLDKLKQSMAASIEQLHAERDQLVEEKNRAIADRDRARVEFEQLVSKNAQLADLNNDITHQIQERFKNHSDARLPANGLGIYNHNKGVSNNSVSLDNASIQTGTTIITPEHEEPIIEARPTVVKIEKKNFSKWKKGSKAVAQNIAKGVNRTVVAFQQPERHPQGMAGESIGVPYNMTVTPVESPVSHVPPNGFNRQQAEASRQGFFGFKKAQTMPKAGAAISASTATAAEPPNVLFGSELTERAEYERRQIPSVITRCIEEVELRGMEMEGIYRKTGGNSQVKIIQEGFDKNENFDISDPDMDITAVTSVLKQYFRKLPTPLLTYDVYDRVLETNCEYHAIDLPSKL
ncbi:rho GTPase activator Rga [Xylaria bambusicola]|uniref:rho GTPase activator Rga n=1 Tax=Xylaria bambusicola TaxID=326684 RepID=UPI0020083EDE|nr:rho GTPase activator Rga [Xylaria bambusicola]KAI0521443.1 rho GTPase activator Rga [Xylaria bambusicola]